MLGVFDCCCPYLWEVISCVCLDEKHKHARCKHPIQVTFRRQSTGEKVKLIYKIKKINMASKWWNCGSAAEELTYFDFKHLK